VLSGRPGMAQSHATRQAQPGAITGRSLSNQEHSAQGRQKRTLSVRERQEIQKVLWRIVPDFA
jgi:hypothetical protein